MKRKTKVWLIAGAVLVVVLVLLGYILFSGKVYITQDLRPGEVQVPTTPGDWYAMDFLSGKDGSRVATAAVSVYSYENICYIWVSLWHEEGTAVDEISLGFNPVQPPDALAVGAPEGYPYPLAEFQRTTDGSGVIYSIPNAGFQGTGTLNFHFWLRKDVLTSLSSPGDQLHLHIDFTMHHGGILKMTRQHTEGDFYFGIP